MYKYAIISFIILLLLISPIVTSLVDHNTPKLYTNITVDEAYKMLTDKNRPIFIDIRGSRSFLEERIFHSNITCYPYYLFFDYSNHRLLQKINPNYNDSSEPRNKYLRIFLFSEIFKNRSIIFYCNIGETSEYIAKEMSCNLKIIENNVSIYNLIGGIEAWKAAGYPVIRGLGYLPELIKYNRIHYLFEAWNEVEHPIYNL